MTFSDLMVQVFCHMHGRVQTCKVCQPESAHNLFNATLCIDSIVTGAHHLSRHEREWYAFCSLGSEG